MVFYGIYVTHADTSVSCFDPRSQVMAELKADSTLMKFLMNFSETTFMMNRV